MYEAVITPALMITPPLVPLQRAESELNVEHLELLLAPLWYVDPLVEVGW
jgi:hypothetical protein